MKEDKLTQLAKKNEAKGELGDGNTATILGVKVVSKDVNGVIEVISEKVNKKAFAKPFFVVSANPEMLVLASKDVHFKQVLMRADLVFAEAVGLKLGGAELRAPGRMVWEGLLRLKLRNFFLGGRNGVAKLMAEKYGGEWDEGEDDIGGEWKRNKEVIAKINSYKPDLLMVAYGVPGQEQWIAKNMGRLKCKVAMGVGGSFDYLTGKAELPPRWVAGVGLEWLWRLVQEPWRWRRQVRLVEFVLKVVRERIS